MFIEVSTSSIEKLSINVDNIVTIRSWMDGDRSIIKTIDRTEIWTIHKYMDILEAISGINETKNIV